MGLNNVINTVAARCASPVDFRHGTDRAALPSRKPSDQVTASAASDGAGGSASGLASAAAGAGGAGDSCDATATTDASDGGGAAAFGVGNRRGMSLEVAQGGGGAEAAAGGAASLPVGRPRWPRMSEGAALEGEFGGGGAAASAMNGLPELCAPSERARGVVRSARRTSPSLMLQPGEQRARALATATAAAATAAGAPLPPPLPTAHRAQPGRYSVPGADLELGIAGGAATTAGGAHLTPTDCTATGATATGAGMDPSALSAAATAAAAGAAARLGLRGVPSARSLHRGEGGLLMGGPSGDGSAGAGTPNRTLAGAMGGSTRWAATAGACGPYE